MKRITSVFLLCAMAFGFTSCKSSEFCNIVSFTENFNKSISGAEITYEDYIIEQGNVYYAFFPRQQPIVLVKLTENEQGQLEKCSVTYGKYNSNGEQRNISEEDVALFYRISKAAIKAFTSFSTEESCSIADEFSLYDVETIKKQGETNKTQNSYRFVYYSNSLVSMFTVTNTWLCEIEKTEKPESKPYFGNTTNVDGESIKLSQ